ncbi:MAG TPA: aspartate--tRNA ligase [Actinomycetota bacterium]|nr:aspartate--tRNA ligase [Actinomycetota bacterium]
MSERLPGGRTSMCGELRAADVGQTVVLSGWVATTRDQGGVVFVDLRDRDGVVQVVAHREDSPEAQAEASRLRSEWVVRVTGEVRNRPPGTTNDALATGEIEVVATDVEVLSESDTPPFPIEDGVQVDEALRLRYRYLDLRRPGMTRSLRTRHRAFTSIREYFDARGFVDVETPILTKSTPEGARDFLVPSRLQRGKVYALPQSPQQFKQLLMVAGIDRYYQIARCFRDEDLRADRHWEFTQLDAEMSFATEEDVFEVFEGMFAKLWRDVLDVDIATPFPRLSFDESMRRYGSDKPDTRYGMELADLTDAFRGSGFQAFARAIESGGIVKGLAAPGAADWSRKQLDELVQETKSRGAAGLVWIAVREDGLQSPVVKFLSESETAAITERTGAGVGDLMLLVADGEKRVNVALDGLRRHMADRLGLVPPDRWNFLWITEFPIFEWNEEEGKWDAQHHPFTAPVSADLDPATARARAYDAVLNGLELGSGSIRIHDPELQRKVFDTLGISAVDAEEKFGHMLEAFRLGVPPHGGFALGLDRIVMLLTGHDNIRDVIAFPKTSSGQELLTGAPSAPSDEQLRLLGMRWAQERQTKDG